MPSMKAPRSGALRAFTGVLLAFPLILSWDLSYAPAAAHVERQAADAVALTIQGRVAHPRTYSAADLQHLVPTTVSVSQASEHGVRPATYTGVLLRALLDQAGLVDQPGPKTHLRHTVLASGRDGYAVAVALGEFDPTFENKQVIVAYARDGKPLAGLQLIVPGDHRAGRSVRDLVSLDVR